MTTLNHNQRVAYMFYKAYSALCGHAHDGINNAANDELREARQYLFKLYKQYDHDNSFDE